MIERGDYDAADAALERGLAQDPDDDTLWKLRFRVLVARAQQQRAVAAYRRRPSPPRLTALARALLWYGLRHPEPAVRLEAIQIVRRLDAASLIDEVSARLDDPDELVRTWAAVAMSKTRRGADTLEAQLGSSNDKARAIAIREVGRIAGEAALSTLLRFVPDPSPEARAACATALGHAAKALEPLRKLARDPAASVRQAAVGALARLRAQKAAPTLRAALDDGYLGVRLAAVSALATTLEPEDARRLLRRLVGGNDALMALRAAPLLHRLGTQQPALNAVARGLVDRRSEIRVAAIKAATQLGDEVAARLLARPLRDPQPSVRLAAARALLGRDRPAALRSARGVRALACGADTKLVSLCIEAADLLARAHDADGPLTLARLFKTAQSASTRQSALRYALLRGDSQHLALTAIADRDPLIGLAAAEWLLRRSR